MDYISNSTSVFERNPKIVIRRLNVLASLCVQRLHGVFLWAPGGCRNILRTYHPPLNSCFCLRKRRRSGCQGQFCPMCLPEAFIPQILLCLCLRKRREWWCRSTLRGATNSSNDTREQSILGSKDISQVLYLYQLCFVIYCSEIPLRKFASRAQSQIGQDYVVMMARAR